MTEGAENAEVRTHDASRATLIDALVAAGLRQTVPAGHVLCHEHSDSAEAFVVVDGAVDAVIDGHDGPVTVATHEAGALVGEVSTLIGGHRTASLVAAATTDLAVIDRASVRDVFDRHPDAGDAVMAEARERTDRSRVAALLSSELQTPDADVVAAIARSVTWTSLRAGEVLFRRDAPADSAYLVVSGRLELSDLGPRDDSTGRTGDRVIDVGRGGIVGEFGLLEGRGRSATATALRDTSLARLSAEDFRRLTHDHSSLAMGLVRRVLERSAGDDVVASSRERSFSLAVTTDLDHDALMELRDTITGAVSRCGTTLLLDANGVDDALGRDHIADTAPGAFGEVRLAELLHQSETDVDHLILDAGDGVETRNWMQRAIRQTDQLVVVCSPDPAPDEAEAIDRLFAAAPVGIPRWLAVVHPADQEWPDRTRRLRERFGADEVHHLRDRSERDLSRVARLAAGRGVGLVLSGGGARGNAHIGVYRNLLDAGVPVDRVIGSSMGSIVAGAIGQQLDPDRLLADMRRGSSKLLDYTLPVVSLLRGKRIVDVLEHQFGETHIDDLWVPFTCLSTNLTTAAPHLHRTGRVATAIRASIAIPGILPPVPHGGDLLADGGILDNLPVGVFSDDPSIDVIIASDVAPPSGPSARADYGLSVSGWSLASQRILPSRLRDAGRSITARLPGRRRSAPAASARPGDHPSVTSTLLRSLMIGSAHSREAHLANGDIDLYLDLDLRGVGLLDFETVATAADRGAEQSEERIDTWLAERDGSPWRRSDQRPRGAV